MRPSQGLQADHAAVVLGDDNGCRARARITAVRPVAGVARRIGKDCRGAGCCGVVAVGYVDVKQPCRIESFFAGVLDVDKQCLTISRLRDTGHFAILGADQKAPQSRGAWCGTGGRIHRARGVGGVGAGDGSHRAIANSAR